MSFMTDGTILGVTTPFKGYSKVHGWFRIASNLGLEIVLLVPAMFSYSTLGIEK